MNKLQINKKILTENNLFAESEISRDIEFIVLHHTEFQKVDKVIAVLKEHGVSAHYVIEENGKIFQLVENNNIAYHAGVSNFRGFEGLNKNSIGIEICTKSAFKKGFTKVQMKSCLELCDVLKKKYKIAAKNIIGHSDIGYTKDTGFVNRKQDPSHLFDWKFLSQNGVGIFHEIDDKKIADEVLFEFGKKDKKISKIKKRLAKFGYKVTNFSEDFDEEMALLSRVFNRHFNAKVFVDDFDENDLKPEISANANKWYLSSELKLENILKHV